jgi:hypothetical protein
MTGTFRTRIPRLSNEELRDYLRFHQNYQTEAVLAAMAELQSRGQDTSGFDTTGLLEDLRLRDAIKLGVHNPGRPGFFRDGNAPRMNRVRAFMLMVLLVGFSSSALIYRQATATSSVAVDLESQDSKKYLRDLEVIGGKANVVASDIRHGFISLWEGERLAGTVAVVTVLVATGFWVVTTRSV